VCESLLPVLSCVCQLAPPNENKAAEMGTTVSISPHFNSHLYQWRHLCNVEESVCAKEGKGNSYALYTVRITLWTEPLNSYLGAMVPIQEKYTQGRFSCTTFQSKNPLQYSMA
jgi:hypothetical protein